MNIFGILLAFGAAFSGMLLVRECLLRETEALLEGSGAVTVPTQPLIETVPLQEADLGEAERRQLTQEELFLAVEVLKGTEERYPHEPREGQMAMAQAIESGREWLEEFLLPRLGVQETVLQEYRINCYLWTRQAQDGAPFLSYWTVSVNSKALSAELILDAMSGQVLSADVTVFSPVEYQEQDSLIALLGDYTDSLGMGGDYLLLDTKGGMYQNMGENGLCATLRTSSIAISSTSDADFETVKEGVLIHLYLDNWMRWEEGAD